MEGNIGSVVLKMLDSIIPGNNKPHALLLSIFGTMKSHDKRPVSLLLVAAQMLVGAYWKKQHLYFIYKSLSNLYIKNNLQLCPFGLPLSHFRHPHCCSELCCPNHPFSLLRSYATSLCITPVAATIQMPRLALQNLP